eukprot:scpid53198/ scgid11597/ 
MYNKYTYLQFCSSHNISEVHETRTESMTSEEANLSALVFRNQMVERLLANSKEREAVAHSWHRRGTHSSELCSLPAHTQKLSKEREARSHSLPRRRNYSSDLYSPPAHSQHPVRCCTSTGERRADSTAGTPPSESHARVACAKRGLLIAWAGQEMARSPSQ